MVRLLLSIMFPLFLSSAAFGHGTLTTSADISVDEKLGQYVSADATFLDETGKRVHLKQLIDKPTIIAPVYLSCMHECPMLLSGISSVLGKIKLIEPAKDFRVITLSFDEKDTPRIAADKKKDYLKAIGKPFPADAWNYLTGDESNIRKFTDSIGFKFRRDGHDFSHPITVVVVAPGGKIVRYFHGVIFLPFDMTMALTEAAQGKVGSTTNRVLHYCFNYDPLKKTYVFNILKVTGTVVLVLVAVFLSYLLFFQKRSRRL